MNDKLKEIIAIAMEADEKILYKFFPGDGDGYLSIYAWDASGDNLHIQYKTTSLTSYRWEIFSVSDLLFNHEFMRALVGERGCIGISDKPCPITGYSTQREAIPFCAGKHCRWGESGSSRYIVGHINTILEAAKLPTDQQRIDYVHGLIKGE